MAQAIVESLSGELSVDKLDDGLCQIQFYVQVSTKLSNQPVTKNLFWDFPAAI